MTLIPDLLFLGCYRGMETVGADIALQLLKFLRVMGVGARLPGLSSKVQSPLNCLIAGHLHRGFTAVSCYLPSSPSLKPSLNLCCTSLNLLHLIQL